MSAGVPLTETILESTVPASFARAKSVSVYQRGTLEAAQAYSDEPLTKPISQPLTTDRGGRPRGEGEVLAWFAPGSYDLAAAEQTIPWEAAKGGSGGAAVSSVAGRTGAVTLAVADVSGAATSASVTGEVSAREAADAVLAAAIPSLNAKAAAYGAVGNGTTDDTTALQAAINAAIAAKLPLYLPPGTYKTTAQLTAASDQFMMFGAGPTRSVIKPVASTYHALEIGTGSASVGRTGFLRDVGFAGGNAEIFKTGIVSVTGKAAIQLNGTTHYEINNAQVAADSRHDIGINTVNNCYGTSFSNFVAGQNGCRVGVNLGSGGGEGSGSDITFNNCWLSGEVAGVVWGNQGGGYHFHGGQILSSLSSAVATDGRGSVIAGLEYLTGGTTGSAAVDSVNFFGVDFEDPVYCWCIRAYNETDMNFTSCRFQGNGAHSAIGFFKSSAFHDGRLSLINNRFAGTFTSTVANMITTENEYENAQIFEVGSHGQPTCNGVTPYLHETQLSTGNGQATAIAPRFFQFNGLRLKREGELFRRSLDNGATWKTVKVE